LALTDLLKNVSAVTASSPYGPTPWPLDVIMNDKAKCVYCGSINPKWAKAHVMPRLMGTFENQPTLTKRVCAACDREIGQCEAIIAKCTIEAVLLKHIGIIGRHKAKSPSAFRRGHSGHPPIRMTTIIPGYDSEIRVEPIGDSNNVDILPQIILIDGQGNREEVVINDPNCISIGEWSLLVRKCLSGGVKQLEAIVSNEQAILIKHILHQFGITFDCRDDAKISPFQKRVLVKGSMTYDERYFRAAAKIAFHYFLCHSNLFKGSEEEFEAIRRFIRYGDGSEKDFIEKGELPIVYDPSGADRPPYYGHILRTEIIPGGISVYMQLFIGHDYKPRWLRVRLSQKARKIFLATEEFGHYFRYLEPDKRSRYDGVIEKMAVAQTLKLPRPPSNHAMHRIAYKSGSR